MNGVYRSAACFVLTLLLVGTPAVAQRSSEIIERAEWSIGDWWEGGSILRPDPYRLTVVAKDKDSYVLVSTKPGVRGQDSPGATKQYTDLDGWTFKRVSPDGTVKPMGDKY